MYIWQQLWLNDYCWCHFIRKHYGSAIGLSHLLLKFCGKPWGQEGTRPAIPCAHMESVRQGNQLQQDLLQITVSNRNYNDLARNFHTNIKKKPISVAHVIKFRHRFTNSSVLLGLLRLNVFHWLHKIFVLTMSQNKNNN